MRDRNSEMRGRLDRILAVANDNDLLFEKTKRLVLKLLETQISPIWYPLFMTVSTMILRLASSANLAER